MGPAGKLIHIRQGDGDIEEYAGRFWEVARRSATEKTCLLVFFWGGLAEPFKTRMPYWNPEESLEGYLNLALRLSCAAFRVGSAAEPARDFSEVAASSYSAPDTAMPTHTALEAVKLADVSSEVAELALGHLKAVESAEASSEMAVFAHTAHEAPYAAVPAHIFREAVDFADVSSETAVSAHTAHEAPYAAVPAHIPLEAVESADVSFETAVFAHTAHEAPYAAVPAHILREAVDFADVSSEMAVSAPTGELTESALDSAPFREPTQSAPEPTPVREPTDSAPEPTQSAPEPIGYC